MCWCSLSLLVAREQSSAVLQDLEVVASAQSFLSPALESAQTQEQFSHFQRTHPAAA